MSLGLTTWDWITYPVASRSSHRLPVALPIAVGPCDNFRVLACPLVLSTLLCLDGTAY